MFTMSETNLSRLTRHIDVAVSRDGVTVVGTVDCVYAYERNADGDAVWPIHRTLGFSGTVDGIFKDFIFDVEEYGPVSLLTASLRVEADAFAESEIDCVLIGRCADDAWPDDDCNDSVEVDQ